MSIAVNETYQAKRSGMMTGAMRLQPYKTRHSQLDTILTHIATVDRPILTGVYSWSGVSVSLPIETTFQLVRSIAMYIVERKKL
jgi:hypothetical protein